MELFSKISKIRDDVGNNAFGRYSDRENVLTVPTRIFGDLADVRIGERTAFREFDDRGNVVEYTGLEHFVSTEWNGIPLHIVDNHNYALAFWCGGISESIFSKGATLAHIDMHSDLWSNENDLDSGCFGDATYLEEYVNLRTSVGTYIEPACDVEMFGRFVRIEGEGDLRREKMAIEAGGYDGENLVLNLDLDFFAPDLDDVPFDLKKTVILEFARRAKMITVATSPCFIDQELAIAKLRELFG